MTMNSNSQLRRFVGWLSGDLPELHNVEVPRIAESLERFLIADSAGRESEVTAASSTSFVAALGRAIDLIVEDEENVTHHAAEGEEADAASYSRRALSDAAALRQLAAHLERVEQWAEAEMARQHTRGLKPFTADEALDLLGERFRLLSGLAAGFQPPNADPQEGEGR